MKPSLQKQIPTSFNSSHMKTYRTNNDDRENCAMFKMGQVKNDKKSTW